MAHRLLLFNPENDLALAHGTAFFTPPASAVTMARELGDLPQIWADADDVVFHLYDEAAVLPQYVSKVVPWGWSDYLVAQLQRKGLDASLLPSKEQMEEYRRCASRATAVKALERICRDFFKEDEVVGAATWCTTIEAVCEVHRRYGNSMMKAPWSGSGRGLHRIKPGEVDARSIAWANHIIQKQGAVVVEKFYEDKVLDFAMEFSVKGGMVHYEGLSVFATKAGGVYAGNIVASESYKEDCICKYVSRDMLKRVEQTVSKILETGAVASWYEGPIGVDMMVVRLSDGVFHIHPFVEMNHRMTMGWVALLLARKQPADAVSFFSIGCENGHYSWQQLKNS